MASRNRPTVVLIMAILNIVFGSFGLLGSLCGIGMIAASRYIPAPPGAPGGGGSFMNIFSDIPGYATYMAIMSIIGCITGTALLVSGIGLLRMRSWARWVAVAYCPVAILLQIANTAYTVIIVNPAKAEMMNKLNANLPQSEMVDNIVTIASGALGLSYAVVLLVMMLLPGVSAAFAGRLPMPGPPQDYYDEPEEGE